MIEPKDLIELVECKISHWRNPF